jgi:hypothetical protein
MNNVLSLMLYYHRKASQCRVGVSMCFGMQFAQFDGRVCQGTRQQQSHYCSEGDFDWKVLQLTAWQIADTQKSTE